MLQMYHLEQSTCNLADNATSDYITYYLAYASGYVTGTYIGILIEEKMAMGE
jgi:uncharacterized protein YebE (UPF0316 family)